MRSPFPLFLAAVLAACSVPELHTDTAQPPLPAASAPVHVLARKGASPPDSALAPATVDALQPSSNLFIQGIPPIPKTLVDSVASYTEFRGHAFVDWHPSRREMLVSHRKLDGQTVQLFRLAAPMGELEQLTDFADPVRNASYEPRQGRYLVFEKASGGNEANQVYRMDLPTKQVTLLTDPDERHDMQGWLNRTSALLVSSVPLDKTAAAGGRAEVMQTLRLMDPAQPGVSRKIAELPGTGWHVGAVSWDDRQVALTRYISATESQVWLLNLASGKSTQVLPAPGTAEKGVHLAGPFTRDNTSLFIVSDRKATCLIVLFYSGILQNKPQYTTS